MGFLKRIASGNFKTDAMRALKVSGALVSAGGTALNDTQGINYGQKNDAILGGAKKAANAKAAAEEQAHQDQMEHTRQGLLTQADASFGHGMSPEAQANASRQAARREAAMRSAFTTGRDAAEGEYSSGLTDTRAQLARSGLNGSGMEAQARGDLLARYFGKIAGAKQDEQQAGQNFDNSATTSRLGLRKAVQGGQITDTTGLSTELAGIQAQGSNANLWANVGGQFAPAAAGNFANNRLARAYGSGA